jgi:hypothetical protein
MGRVISAGRVEALFNPSPLIDDADNYFSERILRSITG